MIKFVVFGMPAPQGSKRFVGVHGGRGVMVESSKKVRPWREDVRAAALVIRDNAPPLDGPLIATMIFTLPKPKSAPKRARAWPDKKPDLSKLIRSTEDAMVSAGLIKDDSRIVELSASKVFVGDHDALNAPGVVITIGAVK